MTTATETPKLPDSRLTKRQCKQYGPKSFHADGVLCRITATVRHDDQCDNGHNSFSITAEIDEKARNGRWVERAGGRPHDEVAKHFPKLEPYLKWHLCGTNGPLHYVANTLYLAGDRDCWGKRKGEPKNYAKFIRFDDVPILHKLDKRFAQYLADYGDGLGACETAVVPVYHDRYPDTFDPKWTFQGYPCKRHECPFNTRRDAVNFLQALARCKWEIVEEPVSWGEGKERELDAARRAAIWPEATDEELSADPEELKRKLLDRLPDLMERFKADVESLGLTY